MERLIEFIPRESFNTFNWFLLICIGVFGSIVTGVAFHLDSQNMFHCFNEQVSRTKEPSLMTNIDTICREDFEKSLTLAHPLPFMCTYNFGWILFLSFAYAMLVKHRVQKFVRSENADAGISDESTRLPAVSEDPQELREKCGLFSTFFLYIAHLVIARLVPLFLFAVIFFRVDYPDHYLCSWQARMPGTSTSNQTNSNITLDCTNSNSGESVTLARVVGSFDVVVLALSFLELFYLVDFALDYTETSFIPEEEFCVVYLMQKRKRYRTFLKKIKRTFQLNEKVIGPEILEGCKMKIRDIYVNPRVTEEENEKSRRIYDILKEIEEDKQNRSRTKSILVTGKPGIGKTMFVKNVLLDWKNNAHHFWRYKVVLFIQFRRTVIDNIENLGDMLHIFCKERFLKFSEEVYQFVKDNPSKSVLVIDSLDEINTTSRPSDVLDETDSLTDKVFNIIKKIVKGTELPGVTVLVTSRATSTTFVDPELNFTKTIRISEFSPIEVEEFVSKFFPKEKKSKEKKKIVKSHMRNALEVLSLCESPVNSYIVCSTLSSDGTPKTLTQMYKRAVKVMLWRHHSGKEYLPKNYLSEPLPDNLMKFSNELNEFAKKRFGKEDFRKRSVSEHLELANYDLFAESMERPRNRICFQNLALQAFLFASYELDSLLGITTNDESDTDMSTNISSKKIDKFVIEHVGSERGHWAIQFFAGLLWDKSNEINDDDDKLKTIVTEIQSWFVSSIHSRLLSNVDDSQIFFFGINCLYELQDGKSTEEACKKLENRWKSEIESQNKHEKELRFSNVILTTLHWKALFEFLRKLINIPLKIEFQECKIEEECSCKDMKDFVSKDGRNIASICFTSCFFHREFVEQLCDGLKSTNHKHNELELKFIGNKIVKMGKKGRNLSNKSDEGDAVKLKHDDVTKHLSDVLTNRKVTKLDVSNNEIGNQGAKCLSEALKSKDCKLTELNISSNKIGDEGIKKIGEALKSKICKLSSLKIGGNDITDEGAEDFCEILERKNSKKMDETDNEENHRDENEDQNNKFTELDINGNRYLTSQFVQSFCERMKRCNITVHTEHLPE